VFSIAGEEPDAVVFLTPPADLHDREHLLHRVKNGRLFPKLSDRSRSGFLPQKPGSSMGRAQRRIWSPVSGRR
jgi:hypothetical protein